MPLLGWLALAFFIALLLAAIHGVKSAYRSIRKRYREKRNLARDFAAAGIAPRAATTGKRVGMAVAATVTGPGVTWRALLDGIRRGWRVGKRWTEMQRNRRRRATATTAPPPNADEKKPDPPPSETCIRVGCDKPRWTAPGNTRPYLVCREHAPDRAPKPTPAPPTKGTTVPIETKTGGEVHTSEQLKQELGAIRAEATAELEAASADLQSMQEDVARVDKMSASLADAEISSDTRKAIEELAGTNAACRAAHQARMAAAETRRAAAQKALDTFTGAKQTKFHANAV